MAAEFTDSLDSIDKKLRLLLDKMAQLTKLNATLVESNRALTEDNRQLKTAAVLRESEISHLKTQLTTHEARQKADREYHHSLKQEIDQSIAQIDVCIGQLQQF